jgi:hypothetical protein
MGLIMYFLEHCYCMITSNPKYVRWPPLCNCLSLLSLPSLVWFYCCNFISQFVAIWYNLIFCYYSTIQLTQELYFYSCSLLTVSICINWYSNTITTTNQGLLLGLGRNSWEVDLLTTGFLESWDFPNHLVSRPRKGVYFQYDYISRIVKPTTRPHANVNAFQTGSDKLLTSYWSPGHAVSLVQRWGNLYKSLVVIMIPLVIICVKFLLVSCKSDCRFRPSARWELGFRHFALHALPGLIFSEYMKLHFHARWMSIWLSAWICELLSWNWHFSKCSLLAECACVGRHGHGRWN